MARQADLVKQAMDENGQVRDVEILSFDDLVAEAGELKRTVNKARRGNLADYNGQAIYVLGLEATKRGKKIVRISTNSDRSDPSRVSAPPAVVNGLERAYSKRPNAVFHVKVVPQGKKSCTLANV